MRVCYTDKAAGERTRIPGFLSSPVSDGRVLFRNFTTSGEQGGLAVLHYREDELTPYIYFVGEGVVEVPAGGEGSSLADGRARATGAEINGAAGPSLAEIVGAGVGKGAGTISGQAS